MFRSRTLLVFSAGPAFGPGALLLCAVPCRWRRPSLLVSIPTRGNFLFASITRCLPNTNCPLIKFAHERNSEHPYANRRGPRQPSGARGTPDGSKAGCPRVPENAIAPQAPSHSQVPPMQVPERGARTTGRAGGARISRMQNAKRDALSNQARTHISNGHYTHFHFHCSVRDFLESKAIEEK